MTRLVLPDPSLVLLIGAAGSGKSTFAARWFRPEAILSSDALRARITGDAADQRASGIAFRILHQQLEARLAVPATTVVDATNLTTPNRRPILDRARRAGLPVVAVVLALPAAVIHARNRARDRVVDAAVVDRHLGAVAGTTVDRLTLEGVTTTLILRDPASVDALIVERTSRVT